MPATIFRAPEVEAHKKKHVLRSSRHKMTLNRAILAHGDLNSSVIPGSL
jgi:hypothetical protein